MGHIVVKISEVSEDNKVFSAAKVRKRFEGDDDLEKKIAETIEAVQKEKVSAKEKVSQSFREAHEKLNTEEIENVSDTYEKTSAFSKN